MWRPSQRTTQSKQTTTSTPRIHPRISVQGSPERGLTTRRFGYRDDCYLQTQMSSVLIASVKHIIWDRVRRTLAKIVSVYLFPWSEDNSLFDDYMTSPLNIERKFKSFNVVRLHYATGAFCLIQRSPWLEWLLKNHSVNHSVCFKRLLLVACSHIGSDSNPAARC